MAIPEDHVPDPAGWTRISELESERDAFRAQLRVLATKWDAKSNGNVVANPHEVNSQTIEKYVYRECAEALWKILGYEEVDDE